MSAHTVTPMLEDQLHHSEEEIAEDFEQEMADVSQDEEDTSNNPNSLLHEAVKLLEVRWPAWKEADGEKRKRLWKALKKDLKALPYHKGVRGEAWKLKAKSYHKWLQNKGRVRPNKKGFYIGRKWTARRVLEDRYKQQVIDLVKERNGGDYVLHDYQPTLNNVLEDVSSDEKAEAKLLAQEWNISGGPGEVQTRFTKKNIYTVTKHFAEEMWKKGGLRMVIMAGWKDDESGEIFSVINDFNPEIAGGPKFEKQANLQRLFEPYLRKCFGEDEGSVNGSHESEDQGSERNEQAANQIKTQARRKVDREEHVRKVIGEDGIIRVPDFDPGNRIEMMSLIRGFLTAHYRRACGNPKATVPFTKLSDFRPDSGIIDRHHAPFGWSIPRDPSKIPKKEARDFLYHVQHRQEEHGELAFRFNKWIDAGGHLQKNVEDPEFDPATVTKRPKPRPRPRVRTRRVASDSESDSESKESSDEVEEKEDTQPKEGPSYSRGTAIPASRSTPRSNDDSDEPPQGRPQHLNTPHPKGKGREINICDTGEDNRQNRKITTYADYPELSYRDPAKIVAKDGLARPGRQFLKPVLKRKYGSQSKPNKAIANNSRDSAYPEHSDTDGSDLDQIQKSLVDPQPSEDAGEDLGTDSTQVAKPKAPRWTITAQTKQVAGQTPTSAAQDAMPQTVMAQHKQAPAPTPTTLPRDIGPRTGGRSGNQMDATPGFERQSNRQRRAPLPRDADVNMAERVGGHKRRVSGNDRTGKKSWLW